MLKGSRNDTGYLVVRQGSKNKNEKFDILRHGLAITSDLAESPSILSAISNFFHDMNLLPRRQSEIVLISKIEG